MKIKNVLGIMIIVIVLLISIYYLYIIIDTQKIMDEIRQVEEGKVVSGSSPLYIFMPREGTKHRNVNAKRYFTWCWGNEGKVWIVFDYLLYENGEEIVNKDYCELIIKKINGEWRITKYMSEP